MDLFVNKKIKCFEYGRRSFSVSSLGLYEKTTCQVYIKFVTNDYLPMFKTLQLFTNIFTSIKVTKSTSVQTQKYLKMPNTFKLGLN